MNSCSTPERRVVHAWPARAWRQASASPLPDLRVPRAVGQRDDNDGVTAEAIEKLVREAGHQSATEAAAVNDRGTRGATAERARWYRRAQPRRRRPLRRSLSPPAARIAAIAPDQLQGAGQSRSRPDGSELRNQQVIGSIPIVGSNRIKELRLRSFAFCPSGANRGANGDPR
jgi:hypothetical protein